MVEEKYYGAGLGGPSLTKGFQAPQATALPTRFAQRPPHANTVAMNVSGSLNSCPLSMPAHR